jgi:hypothetical protein
MRIKEEQHKHKKERLRGHCAVKIGFYIYKYKYIYIYRSGWLDYTHKKVIQETETARVAKSSHPGKVFFFSPMICCLGKEKVIIHKNDFTAGIETRYIFTGNLLEIFDFLNKERVL